MITEFIRNVHFTKLLKTDGRLREFNFRKVNRHDIAFFTIDVSDDRGNRVFFTMEKLNDTWKIKQQSLPVWVVQVETKLHELIELGLQEH